MAVDFDMYAGETIQVTIEVQDEDGNLEAIDGYEAKWKMVAGTRVVERSTPDSITIDGANITFTLNPEDTIDIPPRRTAYHHEASVKAPSGEINTVIRGVVNIISSLVNDEWEE
jgi:hypothetical protein